MRSIKVKLVLATAGLVIVILSIAAFLLMQQKEHELMNDLFEKNSAFAELTAPNIMRFYNLYLAENSFVYFNREIQSVFQKTKDVNFLRIASYAGNLLYDSKTEKDKQYQGSERRIDQQELKYAQSRYPGIQTVDGGMLFVKRDVDGNVVYVDQNGNLVDSLDTNKKIAYLSFPIDNAYTVFYGISYDQLTSRISEMRNRIIFLAAFAVLIGFVLSWFMAGSITKPIKKVTEGAKKIAIGDFKTRITVQTHDETQTLAKTFNQMAQTLEITTKAMIYEERVRKELELAAQIQKDILPKKIPVVKGLDIAAGLIPAEEIGGDCYDFIPTGEGRWLFYLGDVTGHGVSSGIVVSIANAMFYSSSGDCGLKELMVKVNDVLKKKTTANMFLTLVLLQWDEKTQVMRYVSAGHEPMMVYRAKANKVEMCDHGGIALGMLLDIDSQLEVNEVKLEKGDYLVLYSDGIPEAWKNEKEMYGMERFKRLVYAAKDLQSALAIRNAVFADVKQFTGDYKQMDDITAMVIKRI